MKGSVFHDREHGGWAYQCHTCLDLRFTSSWAEAMKYAETHGRWHLHRFLGPDSLLLRNSA